MRPRLTSKETSAEYSPRPNAMKSIVHTGQTTKVYCEACEKFVEATYSYGTFRFSNGVVADNVMRAVCDSCGEVVAVAHQSALVLKEALEDNGQRTTMRLPQELLDYISLQLDQLGAKPTHYDLFLRAILLACHKKEKLIGPKLSGVEDAVLRQPYGATLSLLLTPNLLKIIQALVKASGITNNSELLRRLIVLTETPVLAKPVAQAASRLNLAYA